MTEQEKAERKRKLSLVIANYMNKFDFSRASLAKALTDNGVKVSKVAVGYWYDGKTIRIKPKTALVLVKLFKLDGEKREAFLRDVGYEDPTTIKSLIYLLPNSDVELTNWLSTQLKQVGHNVQAVKFDAALLDGFTNLKTELTIVTLLTREMGDSETFLNEVEMIYRVLQEESLRLLVVYVDVDKAELPQQLVNMLSVAEDIYWDRSVINREVFFSQLVNELEKADTKMAHAYELEMVSGAIPLDSKFYIERTVDSELATAMKRRDSIVLLKGARQVGKTSLLARGIQQAKKAGALVLLTDFQKLVASNLQSLDTFFIAIGSLIANQLDLDVYPQDKWDQHRAPNVNFDSYMRREVLNRTERNVVWAIDEADKLLGHSFSDDIFALFRTWHNERALNPDESCRRLTLVLAYATEPYLFIKDLNQSPFNVGTKITLKDFTLAQVCDLNTRYGLPLNPVDLESFYAQTGGHPYLVRSALNNLVANKLSWNDFLKNMAHDDHCVFADHLRRIIMVLRRDYELLQVMKAFIHEATLPPYDSFFRLHSAGILSGTQQAPRFRCQIYEQYLKKSL